MGSNPKFDCETLMSAVLPFAERMLQRYGEFFPFGGAMRPDGELVHVAGYDGTEQPPSAEIIHLIKEGFVQAAQKDECKATALVYDAKITLPDSNQKSDAIAIVLNHRDSYSVVVFFPYAIKEGELTIGTAFAQQGEADIFVRK